MFRDSLLKLSLHNAKSLTRIEFPTDDLTGKASNPSKYSWDPNARLARVEMCPVNLPSRELHVDLQSKKQHPYPSQVLRS